MEGHLLNKRVNKQTHKQTEKAAKSSAEPDSLIFFVCVFSIIFFLNNWNISCCIESPGRLFIWQLLWKDVPGHSISDEILIVNCPFAFLLPFRFHLQRRLFLSSNQCGKGAPANPCTRGLVWISTCSHIKQVCARSSLKIFATVERHDSLCSTIMDHQQTILPISILMGKLQVPHPANDASLLCITTFQQPLIVTTNLRMHMLL